MSTPDYATKIAALLAKAEDPAATPQEAESYTAKAEALMVRWGISDAQLDEKRRKAKKAGEKVVEESFVIEGSWARGLVHIAFAVSQGLGTVRMLKSAVAGSTMSQRVYFIGFASDVARARALYDSLALQALSARDVWWKSWDGRHRLSANERFLAKRQFLASFGQAVESRLTATRQQAQGEVTESTALVLVDRGEKVDAWLAEKYPKLGRAKASRGSLHGSAAGREAGQRANLGGTQVGGSSSKAIA